MSPFFGSYMGLEIPQCFFIFFLQNQSIVFYEIHDTNKYKVYSRDNSNIQGEARIFLTLFLVSQEVE